MLHTLGRVTCEETIVNRWRVVAALSLSFLHKYVIASPLFVSEWSASPADHFPVHM